MQNITYGEAKEALGVSFATLIRWVQSGKLEPSQKLGREKTVNKESLEAFRTSDFFMNWKGKGGKSHGDRENLWPIIDELYKIFSKVQENISRLETKIDKVLGTNSNKVQDDKTQKTRSIVKIKDQDQEKKKALILYVNEKAFNLFGTDPKKRNPFSLRKIDTSRNITSMLRKGKAVSDSRINKVYENIVTINNECNLFSDLSLDNPKGAKINKKALKKVLKQ